jgi:hypothetical protein|tara:strand:- start:333 stop:590 length:258 start_codon:yes stop_codon:yes gene_type:complete
MTIEDEFSITMEHWNETGDTPENLFTLENIYKYASEKELSAIVHSIIGRLWKQQGDNLTNFDDQIPHPTDKEVHQLVKGLMTTYI